MMAYLDHVGATQEKSRSDDWERSASMLSVSTGNMELIITYSRTSFCFLLKHGLLGMT